MGFKSRIYKELSQVNYKKANNPILKWANDLNKHFFKDIHMANKQAYEKMLSIINREMYIKMTINYHITCTKMPIVTKMNVDEEILKLDPLLTSWCECKLAQTLYRKW